MRNYDVTIYQNPQRLPPGVAAVSAFLFGVLGAVMVRVAFISYMYVNVVLIEHQGMSQVWFVGPIAIRIGVPPFGGDIGFELAFTFSAVTYIAFRSIELRMARR